MCKLYCRRYPSIKMTYYMQTKWPQNGLKLGIRTNYVTYIYRAYRYYHD